VLVKSRSKSEKTSYLSLPGHQVAGQNHNMEVANKYFKNVGEFKCLGPTVTNQTAFIKTSRAE
jgi:hypothetical protein